MRASHVIKGAASNLMCGELRVAAMQLEQSASRAASTTTTSTTTTTTTTNNTQEDEVLQHYAQLQRAVQHYHAFIQSIGI